MEVSGWLHSTATLLTDKPHHYASNRWRGGPQGRFGHFGEAINQLTLLGWNRGPQIFYVVHTLRFLTFHIFKNQQTSLIKIQ